MEEVTIKLSKEELNIIILALNKHSFDQAVNQNVSNSDTEETMNRLNDIFENEFM